MSPWAAGVCHQSVRFVPNCNLTRVVVPHRRACEAGAAPFFYVVMPTTDGRIITLPRYIEPKKDVAILLDRLGLELLAQPPPKVSSKLAETAESEM